MPCAIPEIVMNVPGERFKPICYTLFILSEHGLEYNHPFV